MADVSRSSSSSVNRRVVVSAADRAFTLVELMVVTGIIVLILAFALPAFNYLSGSRSVEAAQNTLSSVLGTARAQAVGVQQPRGLCIYRDASTGRLAVSLVQFKQVPIYWAAGTDYVVGDYVALGTSYYVCILPIAAGGTSPSTNTTNWRSLGAATTLNPHLGDGVTVLDIAPDSDSILLPTGVNLRGAGNVATISGNNYRYYSPTVILFDSQGQLTTRNFEILGNSALAGLFDSASPVPAISAVSGINNYGNYAVGFPTATTPILQSQIGIALFDDETFKTAAPADADSWIDSNATPVMINRYNGTLVKGE